MSAYRAAGVNALLSLESYGHSGFFVRLDEDWSQEVEIEAGCGFKPLSKKSRVPICIEKSTVGVLEKSHLFG
jgi:hypothetical protein